MRLRVGLLLVVLLAAALVLTVVPGGTPDRSDDRGHLTGRGDPPETDKQPRQTSDGEPGEIAAVVPTYLRGRPRVDNERSWRIAPGVRFKRWDRTDARGQIRAYLLQVDPSIRGVNLDYASGSKVPDRAPLTRLLGRDRAVAGVNGGFFDIYDTGAPLGIGQDRQRGFLHAARHTWNNAFWTDGEGTSRIGRVPLEASIAEYPQLPLTNVNSPRARAGAIGVWTRQWGETAGYSITDGQRDDVRMVVVDDGRVVASTTDLTVGKRIDGTVLVGRGQGAAQLRQLRVGSTATIRWRLAKRPVVAISGEKVLLRGGRIAVTDDRFLHPRTAVGIDRDTGKILLLAIDGRQPHSRGYTMVELARMMKRLGADVALNLDGGGSTTLAGRNRKGRFKVLNQPSDGAQRSVPDGIAVIYRKPR
ncbi:MAG: phosphodiester glycosidase family protein [Nocardioides sp.]